MPITDAALPPSMQPQRLSCLGPHGFHRIAYSYWPGPSEANPAAGVGRPTLCVHGLTRNGRDFDALGERLSRRGPVAAPDMPGRGRSAWLADAADYSYPVYLGTVASLIARLGAEEIDYVGTSMGGIIGMMLACQPGSPIRRLVLNDVGPFIPVAALERIAGYVGLDPEFADLDQLERHLRAVHSAFGPLSNAEWRHMAETSHRVRADGSLGLGYDPAIAQAFTAAPLTDVDLWPFYDRIQCPTLVIRGAQSDLLTAETAEEMTRRGPKAELYEVADAGHAPALMDEAQIARIESFFT
ncbi:alpha/beta hydrolase [Aliidongia dinghuensis]|uniref:Alpha/beta hydrolase n=1 Tax=Aliidongia dinghuensis TaxID=1867774 RepID=A0A8J3E7W7_9PROT|nr:alpha/beta hydrolase [Aliidongia dinghuensis]GGF51309.1 alpha/beta hydrolase [Aliidongia dinghuensis]